MEWSKTRGREQDKLIIRNVDNVCEYMDELASLPKLDMGKRLVEDVKVPEWVKGQKFLVWLSNRMRSAWHPDANSYV